MGSQKKMFLAYKLPRRMSGILICMLMFYLGFLFSDMKKFVNHVRSIEEDLGAKVEHSEAAKVVRNIGNKNMLPHNINRTSPRFSNMYYNIGEKMTDRVTQSVIRSTTSVRSVFNIPIKDQVITNAHDYEYVISPRINCSRKEITLIMGVTVSRNNFESRQAIRETWGSYARADDDGYRAVLLFFIGSDDDVSEPPSPPSETQKMINEESSVHGDILQESYVDHYKNLSLKSVSLLRWASLHCPRSKFILKSDDDMYVNVPLLVNTMIKILESPTGTDLFIVGRLHKGVEPIRLRRSKYYTSEKMYNDTVFPLYVSGTSYAMTNKAAKILYETSLWVPLFWLEDVYITGICGRIAGVPIINTYLFPYKRPLPSGCEFLRNISGHKYTPTEMRTIHKELYNRTKVCDNVGR
ncbi:hypothetical protein Btru_066534 [Bulinus truncatus]|nr:hypothetical protein Btru_066534 [Bulinus truncatus]